MEEMAELVVKASRNGQGVFAAEKLVKDEVVLEFNGTLYLGHELPLLYEDDKYIQVGDYLYMGPSGGPSDLVNHSCDPNCALLIEEERTYLVAIRDVLPDEEVTFDYSLTMWGDDWSVPCSCGTAICRGRIAEFRLLPEAVQNRYRSLGVVPGYIVKAIAQPHER